MSYVIALVHDWIVSHPEHYMCWCNPYTRLTFDPALKRMVTVRVGGHYRRLALWAKVVPALRCTCKFDVLSVPRHLSTPVIARRQRWDERGDFVPRRYRMLVFA